MSNYQQAKFDIDLTILKIWVPSREDLLDTPQAWPRIALIVSATSRIMILAVMKIYIKFSAIIINRM